jgi:hypothetical protein
LRRIRRGEFGETGDREAQSKRDQNRNMFPQNLDPQFVQTDPNTIFSQPFDWLQHYVNTRELEKFSDFSVERL